MKIKREQLKSTLIRKMTERLNELQRYSQEWTDLNKELLILKYKK